MIKWVKPNGKEIETNELDATIEAAEKLGWERKKRKYTKRSDTMEDQEKLAEEVIKEAEK